jgi:hypothetical protein
MTDIFQDRIKTFMRIPKQIYNLKREYYAIELRKSRRSVIHIQKRKINGGSILKVPVAAELHLNAQLQKLYESFKQNPVGNVTELLSLSTKESQNFLENIKIVLPYVAAYLDSDDMCLIQHCLYFLNCISASSLYTDSLVENKLHLKLLDVLELGLDDTNECVLGTISNICMDSTSASSELINDGVLDILYSIAFHAEDKILEYTAQALYNIINRTYESLTKNLKETVLKICQICINFDEALSYCLWAINIITSAEVQETVSGFIPHLFNALNSSQNLYISVQIIQNISCQYNTLNLTLLRSGLLDSLYAVYIAHEKARKSVFFILSNVVAGGKLEISFFLCHKIRNLVLEKVSSPDLSIKTECSYILKNLIQLADDLQKINIINQEIFETIGAVIGNTIIIDKNYLEFILIAFESEVLADKVFEYYQNSNCHSKITDLTLSKSYEIRFLSEKVLKSFEKALRN